MTLTQLKTRFRQQVPQAKASVLSDTKLETVLNEAPDEINLIVKIYKGKTEFTSTVGKQTYTLSSDVPNYLGADKSGTWIANSTANTTYDRLIPKTREWFDDSIENWREASNAQPNYYYLDGDELGFDTPFSVARTVRVFHLLKSTNMSSGSNYPWSNTTTEIQVLKAFDKAIIAYAKWQLLPSLDKKADEQKAESDFIREVLKAKRKVTRRPDLSSDHSAGMLFR